MQLMQVYVQKSTSTTRPRSDASVSGRSPGVLNQRWVSANSGASPRSLSPRASASSVASLAFLGAAFGFVPSANLAPCPAISLRRLSTAFDFSSPAVTFTSGMCSATYWSKRTSKPAMIARAVRSITAPSVRCSVGPRPAARTRSNNLRPLSVSASSTAALPSEYASATATVLPLAALTDMTAARIGPAQGVYTKPSAPPTSSPERKPSPPPSRIPPTPSAATRERRASRRSASPGTINARPDASSTPTATSRKGSEPRPTPFTTPATPTIVTVKVTVSPITTPSGLRLPPTPPEANRAGSTGSTHGDSAVPAPASTANPIRISISPQSL